MNAGDWSADELREALSRALDWTVSYRDGVESYPVLPRVEPGDIRERLGVSPPRGPEPFERVLADFDEHIVGGLTHWNHPGFLAYFSSCARGPSIAAELLIAAVGVNAMLWQTSPAATEVELVAVDWLRQAVGLPESFTGVILDTASTSSFTALLAARERAGTNVRDTGLVGGSELIVYTSDQSHSSIEKAAIAAGLGLRSVRRVPVDEQFRMRPEALGELMAHDVESGAIPAFVCATLGTTSTASVDPVREVGRIARQHGAWLHVDAAYAGSAAIVPELRPKFDGWEEADSIVVNPHKWLGTSLDCSVLLFRDPAPFRASLALTPAYLESATGSIPNLMDFGLPLGRRFRGLKLWMLFRCVGTEGLADTLRSHVEMARRLAEDLVRTGRFELAAPVSFSTICFRARGADPADEGGVDSGGPESERAAETKPGRRNDAGLDDEAGDRLNRDILRRVNAEGKVFISHTDLHGRYTLRLSVGSVHTRPRHMRMALEALMRAAEDLTRGGSSRDQNE